MDNKHVIKVYFIFLFAFSVLFSQHAGAEAEDKNVYFVFAGHIRGPRNFTINSLLPFFVNDVRSLNKDFIILGGDIICGYTDAYDVSELNREWDMADRYLSQIGAPIYRVPGNHDWHSLVTKEVYNRRYGPEYYSFVYGDVMFVGINTTKLCPDKSLDWARIWLSNSALPNVPQIPEADQWDFLVKSLKEAEENGNIHNIVLFMNGCLWCDSNIKKDWWEKVHPLLVKTGKVRLVLSGEAGDDKKDTFLKKDGIIYLRNGWGITDDKDFSIRGTYFHIVFEEAKSEPQIFTRFINLKPEYYQSFICAIPEDIHQHLDEKIRQHKGLDISSVNKIRMRLRDWLDENIQIYDRTWNIKAGLSILGAGLLSLIVLFFFRRRR
jgi:3',5'-cyclic AMP phosphodiesterase CpdA